MTARLWTIFIVVTAVSSGLVIAHFLHLLGDGMVTGIALSTAGGVGLAIVLTELHDQADDARHLNELVALALTLNGAIESVAADAIPQRTWDTLYEKEMIRQERDISDEYEATVTSKGLEHLVQCLRDINGDDPD